MGYNQTNFTLNKRNILFEYRFSNWVHNKFFKKPGKLCDVGAGTGNNALAFKRLGYEVSVLDFDEYFFNRLKERKIRCRRIDLNNPNLKFPFKNNWLDYIFAKSVIEHLDKPIKFINEAHRCLKKGGKIFLLTPNWKNYQKYFFNDPTHKSPFTKLSITKALSMNEFNVKLVRDFRNIPYIWGYFKFFPFEITWLFPKEIIAFAEKKDY